MGTARECIPLSDFPQFRAEFAGARKSTDLSAVEADHRVANGLALVATLLRMQRERSNDAAVRDAILIPEARVASIAKFHAYLHRHDAGDRVDLPEYLREIAPEICSGIEINCVLTIRSCEPIEVEGRIATQLTIVINELALNALEHGYGGREGEPIFFELDNDGEAGFRLSVRDNGSGFLTASIRRTEAGWG